MNSFEQAASPKRVLLTGATGFVGFHVAQAFRRGGYEVRALVRSQARATDLGKHGVRLVEGTLEDETALRAACRDVHVVVHMAALTHARTDAAYEEVNVRGTERLLRAMRSAAARPARLLYLSSLAAVGPVVDGRPVCATDPPRPLTAYGRSKLGGERACLAAVGPDIEAIVLRAPAVYGPRDAGLLPFYRLARRGIIPVPRGSARPLQMVHVTDLARALVRAAAAPRAAGVYHIAERRAYTWDEVGRLLGEAVGRRVRVVRVPAMLIRGLAAVTETGARLAGRSALFNRDKARELLAPGWLCETATAQADLDFEADIPLADGLRATAQWYREQGWL